MNDNEETVEITTKLEWEDYWRVNKFIFLQSIYFKILFALSFLFPLYGIICLLKMCKFDLSCLVYGFKVQPFPVIALVLLSLFTVPLGIFLQLFYTTRKVKKYWNSNKRIQEEIKRIFSIEGIKAVSDSSSDFLKWDKIYKIVESKEDLLIFISTLESHIIPKRFFKSAEELEKVKEIIKQKVDPKKVKLLKN
jgi:uncharacterized protein YneF (UPF0154 family)